MSTVDRKPASDSPEPPGSDSAPPPVASERMPLVSPHHATVVLPENVQIPDAPRTLDPMNTSPLEYQFSDAKGTQLAAHHYRVQGPTVYGEYEIVQEIARGGMGVVYRARHRKLNRIVALKTLLEGEGASEAQVKRFYLEATAAARLHHPNIVAIYDVAESGGVHFYAMEYVEGRTFLDMIEKEKVAPMQAAEVVRKIADALAFAHEEHILHRDIKPQNILIDAKNEPKLSDFGLAKDFTRATMLTQSGVALGTPMYMSPEQAMGRTQEIDHRSDIYSLGAVLYHALSRKPPFDGDSPLSIMNKVVLDDPQPFQASSREIDRDLETICLKAMAKEPSHRYATAREMAEDLQRWASGARIRARRPGWMNWILRKARKHRVKTLAGLVLFCAVAVGILGIEISRSLDRIRAVKIVAAQLDRTRQVGRFGTPSPTPDDIRKYIFDVRVRMESALEEVREALDLDPASAEALLLEGELHERRGNFAGAAAAFRKVVERRPDDHEARYLLARALHNRGPDSHAEAGAILGDLARSSPVEDLRRLAEARSALLRQESVRDIATLVPGDFTAKHRHEALRLKALAIGSLGSDAEKEKAADLLDQCLDGGPASTADYNVLALWQRKAKHPDAAVLRTFVNAVALAEKPSQPLLEAMILSLRAGWSDLETAFLHLHQELLPDSPHPYLSRANYYRDDKVRNPEAAERDYLEARRIAPDDPTAAVRLLQLYQRYPALRNPAAYFAECREALIAADRSAHYSPALVGEIAEALIELDLESEAESWISLALERAPGTTDLIALQGVIHHRRRRFTEALKSFEVAIALEPGNYKTYVRRSRCHGELKNLEAAVNDLTMAIQLDPDSRDLHLRRAMRYAQMLKLDRMLEDIEKVTLLSSVEEVEQIREELVSPVPARWFEKLDNGVRQLAAGLLPRLAARLAHRGEAALREKKWDDAKAAFDRARAVDSRAWRALLGLAAVWTQRQEWDYAAHLLLQALDRGLRKPEAIEAHPLLERLRNRPEYAPVRLRLEAGKD